jgi:hypothetical protein
LDLEQGRESSHGSAKAKEGMDMGKVDESIFLFKSRRSQQREKEEK